MTKKFEIIPAIDLIEGKCVRLSQGDYSRKTIYNEHPLEVALMFEDAGISRLHLVDLDGAKKGEVVNLKVLEKIASKTKLVIDFGGGIKSNETLSSVFNAGAQIATIGSLAVKNKELFYNWVDTFGHTKFLLGADVKNEYIAIHGWLEDTTISVYDFIQENVNKKIHSIFCTDISKDGLLEGPSNELYKKILDKTPEVKLIASGGVSNLSDIESLMNMGCKGVIIGKAIYEGKINLKELEHFNTQIV